MVLLLTSQSMRMITYDKSLLLVENATYATKMDKPAAKISEFTHGPLNAPECDTTTSANAGTDSMSAPER